MANADWLNDKYVQNWFQLLGNERTIKNYTNDFPKFLAFIAETTPYKTSTEIIDSRLDHLTTKDLFKRLFWEQQVIKYKNHLESKNLRMATVHGHIRTIMSFFSKNGVKLLFSRGELKINPSEKDKVDTEWIPENGTVRLLYRICESARDRAVLLVLYQSGFSEIDVANMKIEEFPFYDEKGDWAIPSTEDLYVKRRREKTNEWQQTAISREALEEIRIMLQSRGFPKKPVKEPKETEEEFKKRLENWEKRDGYLFVSFRGEQLGVRGINDMLKAVVQKGFNGKSKDWKTKHLRDAFMNGLHQGKVSSELKDAFVGHHRQGAKNDYAITELSIKTAYADAFKYLTINGYGSQSRKVEELAQKFDSQTKTLMELITELREENKGLKMQLASIENKQDTLSKKIDGIDKRTVALEETERKKPEKVKLS